MNVQKTNEKGFTIIEVVLVLAIAALIFLMVFIALPALQRGQRDTQRKNDIARVQTAIQNYQSNNRNAIPDLTVGATQTAFISGYLTVGGDSFSDPGGTPYKFVASGVGAFPTTFTEGTINFTPHSKCGAGVTTATSASDTKIAFIYKLEGGGATCVSN
jgi:prepilin-type N-terminal cleavage/methylation domain-containing protein